MDAVVSCCVAMASTSFSCSCYKGVNSSFRQWPYQSFRSAFSLHMGDESGPPPVRGDRVKSLGRGSAEGEHKRLHACIEKLDLELPISNVPWLPDQLIQPLVGHRAVALLVNVTAVSSARCLSIEEHAKAHGRSPRCRPHDQMQIAGVKAVRDAPVGLVQHCVPSPHRPLTRQGPMIEPQPLGDSIEVTPVQDSPTGGRKVLGALVADIGFRRPQAPPIGSNFRTLGIDRDQFMINATDSCLGQQVLKSPISDCS